MNKRYDFYLTKDHEKKSPQMKALKYKIICSFCQEIIHEPDDWKEEDGKSHGICPDCLLSHFPDEYISIQKRWRIRIKNSFGKGYPRFYAMLNGKDDNNETS